MKYNKTFIGDCRESLHRMAGGGFKAQMCVTSPPYFGLRDYKVDGQIGLEKTPEEYIAGLVQVFRAVWDVLADDGTLWVNIGDSYSNVGKSGGYTGGIGAKGTHGAASKGCGNRSLIRSRLLKDRGFKPKDLIGIPWMVAFALRADGWFLRQDIIWQKPNPMPESVTDRCTKAHEYLFLLSKSTRYFYDAAAIRESSADPKGSAARYKSSFGGEKNKALLSTGQVHTRPIGMREFDGHRNRRSVWTVPTKPYRGAHFAVFPPALIEPCVLAGTSHAGHCPECGERWIRQGTGWAPSCACGADPVPDVVLDPFMGSGTTAEVALKYGRQFLGCELNPEYESLINERLSKGAR